MTDEDNSQGTDAAEAFEAMCVELALLRRAVEGLAAERGAIDATMPNNSSAMAEREWIVMKCIGRFILNNSLVIKCFNSIK